MSLRSTAESTLPVPLTRFVGREHELGEVRQLLASNRLLTVTGAGGSGKTRLALEIATHVPEEIAWIDLAPVLDPLLVPGHVAASMGVPQEGSVPPEDTISTALRDRQVLLVLDNCEHLVGAVSQLTETLLRRCPDLRILTTSREALGLTGEVAWLLPTLSIPAADGAEPSEMAGSEAVELFVARARDVLQSFDLNDANAPAVARICRQLDGLPLAIELAAARVKALTPDQIADRLGDRFRLLTSGSRTAVPRHRTLRGAMDWSYDLLSDSEQLLLQRLSVFSGGFTLDAVEAICNDERVETWEVLDLLARLVDRSLVVIQERDHLARYGLLETVHKYALERIEETGGIDEIRQRHAAFFLDQVETAAPHLYLGGSGLEWLEGVDAEIANLRAAGEWLLFREGRTDDSLRLVTALHWYFYRKSIAEGRRWLERALEMPGPSAVIQARALEALGALRYWQGDAPSSLAPLEEALVLLRGHGERETLARVLSWAGLGMVAAGDDEGAGAALEEALLLARSIRGALLVQVSSIAAYHAHVRGDLGLARDLLEESNRVALDLGLARHMKMTTLSLARVFYEQGDLSGAADRYRENLTRRHLREQGWEAPIAIDGLAAVASAEGEMPRAARLLGAAEVFRHRIGTTLRPYEEADRPIFERLRRQLGPDAFDTAFAEGRALTAEQAVEYALAVGERQPEALPDGDRAGAPVRPAGGPPRPSPGSAAALSVRALGSLEISLHGERVGAEAWSHARPRQLLLYLLCHPKGRSRAQIGLDFWPDASAAQVKNNFHVLLYKLRKTLESSEFIVLEDDRYRINPDLDVWFDAAVFEREVTVALRLLRAGEAPAHRLEETLALYRGDLLKEESAGDWLPDLADRLRRLHADALSALADIRIDESDFHAAARILEPLVRTENLREDAYRRLMHCLARTGRRDEALRHYGRLVTLLRHELDADPEPETQDLAERLRSSAGG